MNSGLNNEPNKNKKKKKVLRSAIIFPITETIDWHSLKKSPPTQVSWKMFSKPSAGSCSGCIYLSIFSITSHWLLRRWRHLGSLLLLISKATIFHISLYFLIFPCCLTNIGTLRLSGSDVANESPWLQLTEVKQTGPLTEKNMHALKNLMSTSAKEHCINFRQQPYFSNIFDAQNLFEDTLDNTSHCFLQFLSLLIMGLKAVRFILFSSSHI